MKGVFFFSCMLFFSIHVLAHTDTLGVRQTADFVVDGKGSHPNWDKTGWVSLKQLDDNDLNYATKFKILYSSNGVYVLFEGLDNKVTTDYREDFGNLFNADVFEVFFHTDPSIPLYFEYEINALNKELVLLIPHLEKGVMGWTPWHYEGDRKVQKNVFIQERNGKMEKWTAEMFFPFKLLSPLGNVPPAKGSCWNANFYRLDYDGGRMTKFAWSPVEKSFHEFKRYGTIRFE
jgi:Carbohydrate family 9 binding domain-like